MTEKTADEVAQEMDASTVEHIRTLVPKTDDELDTELFEMLKERDMAATVFNLTRLIIEPRTFNSIIEMVGVIVIIETSITAILSERERRLRED